MAEEPIKAYEIERFRRAAVLAVHHLGGRQYQVRGTQRPFYYVDLDVQPPCSCEDLYFKEGTNRGKCKHVIAALLAERDPAMVNALADEYLRKIRIEEDEKNERRRVAGRQRKGNRARGEGATGEVAHPGATRSQQGRVRGAGERDRAG